MEVISYKNIEPDEELSLSCQSPPLHTQQASHSFSPLLTDTPLNILSTDRQKMLKFWGFTCTCALCRNTQATNTSDRQRLKVQELLTELDDSVNHTHEKVGAVTAEVEVLVGKEGMVAQIGDLYGIIADVYLAMGDLGLAGIYGELAVELLRHYAGFDSARTQRALGFMEALERRAKQP